MKHFVSNVKKIETVSLRCLPISIAMRLVGILAYRSGLVFRCHQVSLESQCKMWSFNGNLPRGEGSQ